MKRDSICRRCAPSNPSRTAMRPDEGPAVTQATRFTIRPRIPRENISRANRTGRQSPPCLNARMHAPESRAGTGISGRAEDR